MCCQNKRNSETKHTARVPLVTYPQYVNRIRLNSLYQGLEARIRKSRENPNLFKLVHLAQAKIQRTREAIDNAESSYWTEEEYNPLYQC